MVEKPAIFDKPIEEVFKDVVERPKALRCNMDDLWKVYELSLRIGDISPDEAASDLNEEPRAIRKYVRLLTKIGYMTKKERVTYLAVRKE